MGVNNYSYDGAGIKLTSSEEGRRLTAYQDSVGVWTIGDGHTGPDVVPGMTITDAQADALLLSDISTAVAFVNEVVTAPISQQEFDALVDFTFNAGRGALLRSTLLKDVNAGNTAALAHDLEVWDMAGGKVCAPLLKRREAEVAEFESS